MDCTFEKNTLAGIYEWRGDCLVRLDERYRQCVVLIGTGLSDDEIAPWGTGFFVSDFNRNAFLVTAAHVVSDKLDAPFDIRFNEKDGGARNHRVEYPQWFMHPSDPTVDVAVHPIEIPEWVSGTNIGMSPHLWENDRINRKNIGAGNRTYTVGLWKFMHGDRRNQPFVYSGHIGLVPEDQRVPVGPWLPQHGDEPVLVEAYLVEGEPLDGASGSPVFVRRTLRTPLSKGEGKEPIEAYIEGSVWLLGLLSDAFKAKPGRDYAIPGPPGVSVWIPRGVNVVVPCKKIMEVLDQPELAAMRDKAKKQAVKEREATKLRAPDRIKVPSDNANPDHKEDFSRLLRQAAQKREQED